MPVWVWEEKKYRVMENVNKELRRLKKIGKVINNRIDTILNQL